MCGPKKGYSSLLTVRKSSHFSSKFYSFPQIMTEVINSFKIWVFLHTVVVTVHLWFIKLMKWKAKEFMKRLQNVMAVQIMFTDAQDRIH